MTREEAIKILKAIKVYECYPKSASEETKEAIDMAIDALSTEAVQDVGRYENAMQKLREMPRYLNGVKPKQIKKIPSDAIEVVRCKDCKWWQNNISYSVSYCPWNEDIGIPFADDFCSCGERKKK